MGFKSPTDVNDCNWQYWKGASNNLLQNLVASATMYRSSAHPDIPDDSLLLQDLPDVVKDV